MNYRSKPRQVQAVSASDAMHWAEKGWIKLPDWLREEYEAAHVVFAHDAVYIQTPRGEVIAKPGDMILRDAGGWLSAATKEEFGANYEPVEEEPA